MPDAVGIDKFNYDPYAEHSNAASEDAEVREASTEDAKATLAKQSQTSTLDPQGGNK